MPVQGMHQGWAARVTGYLLDSELDAGAHQKEDVKLGTTAQMGSKALQKA